jgi:hypothetical protein
VIFAEIIKKGVKEEQVFQYTAMRLRQLGEELSKVEN